MLRLALSSDLHVEHHPEVIDLVAARFAALKPDVAVVAGDVSHDPVLLEASLAKLAAAVPALAFVPGNHDLWCRGAETGGPSSRDKYLEVIPSLCRRAGAHALQDGPLSVGGVRLVGETGWFDYSLRNRALDETFTPEAYRKGAWGRLRWNDRLHVRFPDDAGAPMDDEALAAWMAARLARALAADAAPTVAVTHHLAFQELVFSRGEPPWDFLNGFIGAACLGEAIAAAPGVSLALAGHTHLRRRATVERPDRRAILAAVSPVGYPREYRAHGDLAARVRERVAGFEIDAAGAARELPNSP